MSAETAARDGRSAAAQRAPAPIASGIGRAAGAERDDRRAGAGRIDHRPSSRSTRRRRPGHSGPASTSRWVSMGAPASSSARTRPRPLRAMATPSPSSSGSSRTGPLTPRLWELRRGARIRLGPPKGLFTADATDPRRLLLVGTGTGIAPLLSILGTHLRDAPAGRPRPARSSCTAPRLRPTSPGGRASPDWRPPGASRTSRPSRGRAMPPTQAGAARPGVSTRCCPTSSRGRRRSRRDARLRLWQSLTRRGRQARPVQLGYPDRCHPHGDVVVATRRAHLEP